MLPSVFFKRGFLIRQHQIRHLNDVELLFKADGLCDILIRKEQMCKVIVRNRRGYETQVLSPEIDVCYTVHGSARYTTETVEVSGGAV